MGQQQQQQPVPLAKLSPAKPRPLVSPFLRSPLSLTGAPIGAAAGAAALSVAAGFSVGLTKACMGQPAFADMVRVAGIEPGTLLGTSV
jgi:hypothetical protein